MKNPILKSIIRRPIKLILLLIILALSSGAFTMNAISYINVSREMEESKESLKSIGYISMKSNDESSDGNIYDVHQIIKDDSMIDYIDYNKSFFAREDDIINADYNLQTEYYNNVNMGYELPLTDRFVIASIDNIRNTTVAKTKYDGIALEVTMQEHIGGYLDSIFLNNSKSKIGVPKYYYNTTEEVPYINNEVIDELSSLEYGENYLFRLEPLRGNPYTYNIKPLYSDGPLYKKVDSSAQLDLNDPELEPMKRDIELIDFNLHSYTLIPTVNMETYLGTQEPYYYIRLMKGRMINEEDEETGNPVCVINKHFNQARQVNIGDKLNFQLMKELSTNYIYTAEDRANYNSYEFSDPIEYEVVGIYNSRDEDNRNIFVPTSTIPEGFMEVPIVEGIGYINLGTYQFVLNSPEDQSAFMEKYSSEIDELGYDLKFIANNAEGFWDSSAKVMENLKMNMILYGVMLLFIVFLIVHMYLEMYKKYYAIERIQGVTHSSAMRHLSMPILSIGSAFIIVASYIGYLKSVDNSVEIITDVFGVVPEQMNLYNDNKYFIIIALGIVLLLALVFAMRTMRLKKLSLLEFFSVSKKVGKTVQETYEHTDTSDLSGLPSFNYKSGENKHFFRNYSRKYIKRSVLTTSLYIFTTVVLVGALLFINVIINANEQFIRKTISETQIYGTLEHLSMGPVPRSVIDTTLRTDLINDYFTLLDYDYNEVIVNREGEEIRKISSRDYNKKGYYEKIPSMRIISSNKDLNGENGISLTGDIDEKSVQLFNSYEAGDKVIPIFASEKAIDDFDLKLGDKVYLKDLYRSTMENYGTVVGTFEGYTIPIMSEPEAELIVNTNEVFIYPMNSLGLIERSELYYRTVDFSFDMSKNLELFNNRAGVLGKVARGDGGEGNSYKLKLYDKVLMDTLEPHINTLEILNIIYPLLFIISVIIAFALQYLMILRRREEFSIMKILGIKDAEIRKYVFRESISLLILCIGIPVIAVVIYSFGSDSLKLTQLALVVLVYMGSSGLGIALSLRKIMHLKPLDMLQVKE